MPGLLQSPICHLRWRAKEGKAFFAGTPRAPAKGRALCHPALRLFFPTLQQPCDVGSANQELPRSYESSRNFLMLASSRPTREMITSFFENGRENFQFSLPFSKKLVIISRVALKLRINPREVAID